MSQPAEQWQGATSRSPGSSPLVANGLPSFTVVGLTDRAIQEARERVRASIRNAGFEFPMRRLTVNLAPAEVPKERTGFDLVSVMATVTPSEAQGGARR